MDQRATTVKARFGGECHSLREWIALVLTSACICVRATESEEEAEERSDRRTSKSAPSLSAQQQQQQMTDEETASEEARVLADGPAPALLILRQVKRTQESSLVMCARRHLQNAKPDLTSKRIAKWRMRERVCKENFDNVALCGAALLCFISSLQQQQQQHHHHHHHHHHHQHDHQQQQHRSPDSSVFFSSLDLAADL